MARESYLLKCLIHSLEILVCLKNVASMFSSKGNKISTTSGPGHKWTVQTLSLENIHTLCVDGVNYFVSLSFGIFLLAISFSPTPLYLQKVLYFPLVFTTSRSISALAEDRMFAWYIWQRGYSVLPPLSIVRIALIGQGGFLVFWKLPCWHRQSRMGLGLCNRWAKCMCQGEHRYGHCWGADLSGTERPEVP